MNQRAPAPAATDTGSQAVSAMFGRIVRWYDPLNRLLSLGLDQGWRILLARAALLHLQDEPSPRLLDLAAGTLDVSLALHKLCPQGHVTAMDFCQPMLEKGRAKLHTPELQHAIDTAVADELRAAGFEIGRASCRERV